MKPVDCPCGGAAPDQRPNARVPRYEACCGRFIDGSEKPANAMELMRSRYTAYVLGDTAYLRATWAESTCPPDLDASDSGTRWLGLQIKRHTPIDADHEEVEFVARYKVDGRAHRLHEASRFTRNGDGNWIYVDGQIKEK
ncbi:YchJ family protein [Caballeronia novacaledonica]|uniref:YchJ family protein n=1 Tax=Caballeronia novacaledonica TaxID=1544861 RepID=A0AA37MQT1_9BURK|nr:YchJ family protein [Caballeronia novacaledonica]GJH23114.1 YchJ family protein [Caballeronia novacaledonica]